MQLIRLRPLVFQITLLLMAVPGSAQEHRQIPVPAEMGTDLSARQKVQMASRSIFRVEHDFRFTDRREASGITFRHRVVADAGRAYKAVHYDHGNGVAAADVNGDGLLDLYFTSQLGSNELYLATGGGRFKNATAAAGVGLADRVSVTASFADADNDGDPDLFVTTVKMGNVFFENLGDGKFRDISKAAGLDYAGHSSGSVFFDYNNDGRLDLFLANVGVYTVDEHGEGGYFIGMSDGFTGQLFPERFESSILYGQTGERTFTDVSDKVLLKDFGWNGDASFVDLNQDGFLDLYVLNMQGDDHFYENQGGQFFVDKATQVFPKTPWGSMGVKFFDYNNDGRLDLYLTDMHSDMSEEIGEEREKMKSRMQWNDQFLRGGGNNIFGNAFYENRDGKMVEISDEIGAENYWPWGISVDDLNADGWDDVFVASSMNYPFRYGVNSVLLNNQGEGFLDSEFILGVEPRAAATLPWFELDCSGADAKHKDCKGQEGAITVMSAEGTRSSILYDYDDDGDLDIITNEFGSRPQVLTSNLAERHEIRYLKVKLRGTASNRDGLGALVTVETDTGKLTKLYDGKSGYLSQSSMPLYFGLTGTKVLKSVTVRWPSGTTQTVATPKVNTLLEIEEKKAEG